MGYVRTHAFPCLVLFPLAREILGRARTVRVLQHWRTRAVGSCDTVWLSEGQIEMAPGEEEGRLDRGRERDNDGREFVVRPLYNPRGYPRIASARHLISTTGYQ